MEVNSGGLLYLLYRPPATDRGVDCSRCSFVRAFFLVAGCQFTVGVMGESVRVRTLGVLARVAGSARRLRAQSAQRDGIERREVGEGIELEAWKYHCLAGCLCPTWIEVL